MVAYTSWNPHDLSRPVMGLLYIHCWLLTETNSKKYGLITEGGLLK
jgi:hypothetical protein